MICIVRWSKKIVLLLSLLSVWTAGTDACIDMASSCPLFQDLCEKTPFLLDLCPFTCNRCPTDPCSLTNGGCSQICTWKSGIVTCSCTPGFRLLDDGKTCVDINECVERPNPCREDLSKSCINTVGSYSCQAFDCLRSDSTTTNYYQSDQCCIPKNDTSGINQSIRNALLRKTNSTSQRIAFGNNAITASWPWMVQLTTQGQHLCGGTLITDSWVVTAADCLNGFEPGNFIATLGHVRNAANTFLDTEKREQRAIDEIIRHPSEIERGYEQNNIALIRLSSPVIFTDTISPISLPCGEVPPKGNKCWVTGFGTIGQNLLLPLPGILQEVDVPVVGINECIRAFQDSSSRFIVNRETMMCAGYEEGGGDACDGDAGGPMMCQRADSCQWYLTGITGSGARCGQRGFYGIYTNVFHFENWIKTTLGEEGTNLCSIDYNPCSFLENEELDCNNLVDACEGSSRSRCAKTCCLRNNGRAPDCFDNPQFGNGCQSFSEQCENPDLAPFLKDNCKRTCGFC